MDYPPSARCILNEIMRLLFAPEAATSEGVSANRVGALVDQFASATKSDITTVRSLLSKIVGRLEIVEKRIEQREIEESERRFEAMLVADKKRRRAKEPIRTDRLQHEGEETWLATDQEVILKRIKSKELLTLTELLETRGVSKRTVSIAITAGRVFCITGPDGQDYYPAFFADSSEHIRQGLAKVCRALEGVHPYKKYKFLTTYSQWIGGDTPVNAIRSGRVNDVLHAVEWLLEPD